MSQTVESTYSGGVFRPRSPVDLQEGQKVALAIDPVALTAEEAGAEITAWQTVYAGLSDEEVADVERTTLDRSRFMRPVPEDSH